MKIASLKWTWQYWNYLYKCKVNLITLNKRKYWEFTHRFLWKRWVLFLFVFEWHGGFHLGIKSGNLWKKALHLCGNVWRFDVNFSQIMPSKKKERSTSKRLAYYFFFLITHSKSKYHRLNILQNCYGPIKRQWKRQ